MALDTLRKVWFWKPMGAQIPWVVFAAARFLETPRQHWLAPHVSAVVDLLQAVVTGVAEVTVLVELVPLLWRNLSTSEERNWAEATARPMARRVAVLNILKIELLVYLFEINYILVSLRRI